MAAKAMQAPAELRFPTQPMRKHFSTTPSLNANGQWQSGQFPSLFDNEAKSFQKLRAIFYPKSWILCTRLEINTSHAC